jgi:hypothetical protein
MPCRGALLAYSRAESGRVGEAQRGRGELERTGGGTMVPARPYRNLLQLVEGQLVAAPVVELGAEVFDSLDAPWRFAACPERRTVGRRFTRFNPAWPGLRF